MNQNLRETYQLKITLKGSKPPIWRRFIISNSEPLSNLHIACQIIMGWTNSHLHQFIVNGKFYGEPDPEFDMGIEMADDSKHRISDVLKKEKDSIIYEYDFGDGWEHQIVLEKIHSYDPKQALPECLKVKGACPPEDVGGIWGYYDFLEAIVDPDHPEHESFKEWIGGDFDPDHTDIDEINQMLKEYCK
ncbi:MAG: plasmid pRiA4b ORF-3 family protein [Gammaproteobacteria bacterium]|nr:plasmid pRiA4b ORF-3 family protein [Gammaproteobacteria bacterium]